MQGLNSITLLTASNQMAKVNARNEAVVSSSPAALASLTTPHRMVFVAYGQYFFNPLGPGSYARRIPFCNYAYMVNYGGSEIASIDTPADNYPTPGI